MHVMRTDLRLDGVLLLYSLLRAHAAEIAGTELIAGICSGAIMKVQRRVLDRREYDLWFSLPHVSIFFFARRFYPRTPFHLAASGNRAFPGDFGNEV